MHSFGCGCQVSTYYWLYGVLLSDTEFHSRLTEHQLQSYKAAHKVIKINGEVSISVAGHQNLEDGIIQGESYPKRQRTNSKTL